MKETTKADRTYKDRLFRMIFNDRNRLLELYNAMNGTSYENSEDLEIVTLENAIYMGMKNDLAFLFHAELNLFEQQSTKNPNMPLRYLFYVSDTYSALVRDKNLYSSRLLSLPTPKFIVFYNGTASYPETDELLLSSACEKKTNPLDLELRVHVININPGCNQSLMENCHTMREYMIFVDKIRRYAESMSLEAAAELAIEECIKEDVLADFLRKNKAEVKHMCLYEYDAERHIKMEREEAHNEGFAVGKESGKIEAYFDTGMTPENIAEKMKISIEKVNEVLGLDTKKDKKK